MRPRWDTPWPSDSSLCGTRRIHPDAVRKFFITSQPWSASIRPSLPFLPCFLSLFHFMHIYKAGALEMLTYWMDERMFAETMDPAPALSLSSSKCTFRLSVFDFFKPDSDVAFNLTSLGWEVLRRSCLLRSQGTLGNPAPRFFQLHSWLKRLLWWINLSSASLQTTAGYCSNGSL